MYVYTVGMACRFKGKGVALAIVANDFGQNSRTKLKATQ